VNRQLTIKTVLGLLLTLGVGCLPFPVWVHELKDARHMLVTEAIYWTLVAAVLAYVVFVEKRSLISIGLRRASMLDLFIGVVIALATIAGLAVLYIVVIPALHLETKSLDTLTAAPVWWLVISVVRAGVSEEVLFRGYPIERLKELTGSRVVAALVPLALFALAHVGPWGWSHLIIAGFGGAMFTGLYSWRRSLWANILAHIMVDGIGLLAS
jgi:membrane protease YdiL (CAAX protease family)